MSELAWTHILDDLLNGREQAPRKNGLTMVIDKGLGTAATADMLEIAGHWIDHWKCSFGTSALVPEKVLRRKLAYLAARNVITYPGGTLLEAAIVQNTCRVFMQQAHMLGFSAVEVSDGTISLPSYRRRNTIGCALNHDLIVITEVGKKDPAHQPSPRELADQALQDLAWGASYVIIEARESGKGIGIYDEHGAVRADAVAEICERMGDDAHRLIWEAPLKKQQVYLIQHFGANVNLGNVAPAEVLALESLRAGLRFETFTQIAEELQRSGQWDPEVTEESLATEHAGQDGKRKEGS
ncbi:MAG: phosphosulfolactate synthase [Ktedonobacteraceae bacterium]|nr:phosphosulfolactate synthase [Ktedonobacteraceae bacterium]